MIRRLGGLFTAISHRFMPHPFVFALLLTLAAYLLAQLWLGVNPVRFADAWYDGFWNPSLMVFALQMALILITGHALADTRPVRRLLEWLSRRVHGTASAAVIVSLVAMGTSLLNWGLGLIVGALLAREVGQRAARRGVRVHYPLVVAAGYTGLLVWHGGLSGSAPLSIATPGHPLEASMGIIPISETLFSPLNVAVLLFLLVSVPLALALMAPPEAEIEEAAAAAESLPTEKLTRPTLAGRLDDSRLLVLAIAALGLLFLVPYFAAQGGAGINLNSLNFVFLLAGLVLHGTPRRYAISVDEAVRGAGGILLQFPFYFGIMGAMRGTGLLEQFADAFVSLAGNLAQMGIPVGSAHAVLTFAGAAVVNVFVPSGGGQWAVQGPVVVQAALNLGTELPTTVMALAYGDQLTNMLQPFWALPLLAITGLHARQIVGYTALLMLLVTPGLLLLLVLFSR